MATIASEQNFLDISGRHKSVISTRFMPVISQKRNRCSSWMQAVKPKQGIFVACLFVCFLNIVYSTVRMIHKLLKKGELIEIIVSDTTSKCDIYIFSFIVLLLKYQQFFLPPPDYIVSWIQR